MAFDCLALGHIVSSVGRGLIPPLSRGGIISADTFETSLQHAKPPEDWSHALQAIWWDARGGWGKAHSLVQIDEADRQCAWVHAYLHRKEGVIEFPDKGRPCLVCLPGPPSDPAVADRQLRG